MLFATLQEAFPGAYKKPNKDNSSSSTSNNTTSTSNNNLNSTNEINVNNINPYTDDADCYYTKEGIKLGSCKNADKIIATNATGSEIVTKNCSPLQVPEYKIPISKKTKTNFKKVLEDSFNDNSRDDNVTINKYSIKPYDYDEYDAYLNVNDIKTNNIDNSPEYRTTPLLKDYLISLRNNFKEKREKTKLENIEEFTNYGNKKFTVDVNIYNLLLFMFIGIIILILCDQIIRLAIIIANNKKI